MGALHQGHLSLVERSARECGCTVVSIFVNPTQFNQAEDLRLYPRPLQADRELLQRTACNALFLPEVAEIYPGGAVVQQQWDFAGLDKGLEGQFRPGHFDGVAQVVKILLDCVQPDVLYLGQKDYQQYSVVRKMVQLEQLPVDVRVCPIIREPDGLAMSSRNVRLGAQERLQAVELSRTLFALRDQLQSSQGADLAGQGQQARAWLEASPGIRLEYLEIVDAQTLTPVLQWNGTDTLLLCVAAWLGGVRLIDNVLLEPAC
jgi:pantoate--beta-alanine ligase